MPFRRQYLYFRNPSLFYHKKFVFNLCIKYTLPNSPIPFNLFYIASSNTAIHILPCVMTKHTTGSWRTISNVCCHRKTTSLYIAVKIALKVQLVLHTGVESMAILFVTVYSPPFVHLPLLQEGGGRTYNNQRHVAR